MLSKTIFRMALRATSFTLCTEAFCMAQHKLDAAAYKVG